MKSSFVKSMNRFAVSRHALLLSVLLTTVFSGAARAADAHAHHHHTPENPPEMPAPEASHVHADDSQMPATPADHEPANTNAANNNAASPDAASDWPVPDAAAVRAAFPELAHRQHAHAQPFYFSLVHAERLEWGIGESRPPAAWDVSASWGDEFRRLYLRSEGERESADATHARWFLNYAQAISPWWSVTTGLRHDSAEAITGSIGIHPGEARTYLGAGLSGTAPYFIELAGSAWLGEGGYSAFLFEASTDWRLTQYLHLTPQIELEAYGKDDVANARGRGLSRGEFGLRLKQEIRRELLPYVGVQYQRYWGDSANWRQQQGEASHDWQAVAGISFWF